jgi:ubiquinone/menaquinone biosynthesis C-methylase UbiE
MCAARTSWSSGAAPAATLAAFKALGARTATGLDLSDGMLAKARERDPSFRLLRHDMTQVVPLPHASADLVLFCLALEHIADLARALTEAGRLLRPAGRVAIVEIHPFVSQDGTAAHFRDQAGEVRMPTYPHRFSDYLNAFEAAGLRAAACREWRPRDLAEASAKMLKRGADFPLVVEFSAVRP